MMSIYWYSYVLKYKSPYCCMYTHLHILWLQPQTLSNFLMFSTGNSRCQNVEEPCRVDAKLSRPFTTSCPATRAALCNQQRKRCTCTINCVHIFQTLLYTYCIHHNAVLQEWFPPIHAMLRKPCKICLWRQEVFCSLHVTTATKITQIKLIFPKIVKTKLNKLSFSKIVKINLNKIKLNISKIYNTKE